MTRPRGDITRWRFTIRGRLYALLFGTALALGAAAIGGGYVFNQIRINGTLYRSILLDKDLEIDFTPPSQLLIETYLHARELVHATEVGNAAAITSLTAGLRHHEEEFEQHNAQWSGRLTDPTSRELFGAASRSALLVFQLIRDQLVPAVERADWALARRILEEEVVPAFDEHQMWTARLVKQIQGANANREQTAEQLVSWGDRAMLVIYGLVLLTAAATVYTVGHFVLNPLGAVVGYFREVSQGNYDFPIDLNRNDEIGDVMRSLDEMRRSRKAAQATLERSEERFALAMAGTNDGLWDWNLTTNECYYSPRWKQMLGYNEDELGSDLSVFEQLLHADDQERVFAAIGDYLDGRVENVHVDVRLRHKNGHYLDVVSRARSAPGPDGRPIRMVGADTDVTQERATQRRLALQHAATQMFVEAGTMETVAPKLLELICKTMNWDFGCFRIVNTETDRLESLVVWQSPALGVTEFPERWRMASFARGEGPSSQAWATGEPCWVVEPDSDVVADLPMISTMHSLCVVPVQMHGQASAVFEYFSREIRPRDDAALQVFSSLSTQLAETVERHRVQEELTRAERRYRDLVEQSVQGIYQSAPDGHFLSVNPAFARMAGYDGSADFMAAGINASDLYLDPGRRSEFLRAIGEKGATLGFEARVRRKDGSIIWISNYARAVKDEHGRIVSIDGAVEDITLRKETEQMKSDFVSFVTHQLRTPLAGIKWMLELADSPDLPGEAASYVHDARQSADRMIQLVNDLLDVSRLESGKVVVHTEPVDLAAVTAEAVRELMPLVNEKHHQVVVPPPGDTPMVTADRQLAKEVVGNLLSNAVRYTPDGGTIQIDWHRANDAVEWSVRDTGIGIPATAQRRLFEKFFRADNASTQHTEGTGLGLYIVRLVVERSGGRVWCESEEGVGSTFRFTLPMAAAMVTS